MKIQSPFLISAITVLFTFLSSLSSAAQSNYYWVGGSGHWSDYANHWATTSGGNVFHDSEPGSSDDIYFDENSFTASGQTVTIGGDNSSEFGRTIDWTGALPANLVYTGSGNNDGALNLRGSLILNEDLNIEIKSIAINPSNGGDVIIDHKGISLSDISMTVSPQFGSVLVTDSLSVNSLTLFNINKTFDLQGYPLHVKEKISITGVMDGMLDFAGSNIYTKSLDFRPTINSSDQILVTDSEIHIVYPDGFTAIDKTKTVEPPFIEFYVHEDHSFDGVNPIFDQLIIEDGVAISSNTGVTEIEFNSLSAVGKRNNRISFYSQNGVDYIQNDGVANVYFSDLENIVATGGADFNAFASIGIGTTTGWNFQKINQEMVFEFEGNRTFNDVGEIIDLQANVNSGLEITYASSNESVARLSGSNELLIVGVGSAEITASQIGDDYYESDFKVRLLEVAKADQQITFEAINSHWIGDEFVNLSASADSDLPLTYTITGPATLNGETIEFNGVGTVQVTASQAGNENYNAAESIARSFEVFKKTQTITFNEIPDTSEDTGFVNLDATSDSGLPVTYSVVGPGRVVDGAMEFTGNGMVQVTAKQGGNELYLGAEEVRRSFEIIASGGEKPLFLTQPEGLGAVYPNPVADFLNFDPQLDVESVHVSDLSGKVYYQGVLNREQLDVSSWEVGSYILMIKTGNGDVMTMRLFKN